MGSRIIFCTAFCLATIVVILLALLSPNASHKSKNHSRPSLDLSLYIQKPHISSASSNIQPSPPISYNNAFIFHRLLTEGPENDSRVVGKAQGFIIPTRQFSQSPFNLIYLTFETAEHSGSLSVQAREGAGEDNKDSEEFKVVGGTGWFAFARGVAVFRRTNIMGSNQVDASYYVRFHLNFPNQFHNMPA